MGFLKTFFRVLIGGFFGLACAFSLFPLAGAFMGTGGDGSEVFWLFIMVPVGILLALFAPTIRRAFGRGFLLLGACVLSLPLTMMVFTGRIVGEVAGDSAAGAVGAGLGAAMMSGVAGFVGFFLGGILIITGLVLSLGGRREVVIVERMP